jgi:hypothetical protein
VLMRRTPGASGSTLGLSKGGGFWRCWLQLGKRSDWVVNVPFVDLKMQAQALHDEFKAATRTVRESVIRVSSAAAV